MTSLVVTAAGIRAFAAALGDRESRDVAPPTFAIVPVLRAVEDFVRGPEIGLDWERVVHRGQTFSHVRPIVAGDELTTRVRLRDNRTVRGSTVVRVDTDVLAGDGPVCSASTTLVARGTGAPVSPARRTEDGDVIGSVRVSRADVARYAAASGDANPIHLDHSAAVAAGLPGVVAHGMLTMGIALRLLGDPGLVAACDAVFSRPVVIGDGVRLVVRAGAAGAETPQSMTPLSVSVDGLPVARVTARSLIPTNPVWSRP